MLGVRCVKTLIISRVFFMTLPFFWKYEEITKLTQAWRK